MKSDRPLVLLVEDNETLRSVLSHQLRDAGYEVEEAWDGQHALFRMGEGGYDLVLTDYRMPKMDGLHLLKALKAWWPHIPVVFLSAEAGGAGRDALALGAFAWLAKPCDHAVVLDTLHAALEQTAGFQTGDPAT